MAKIMVEMELWCSDPREFENLIQQLSQAQIFESENGRHGGYGYEIKVQDLSEKTVRKALGFKKSDLEINTDY